MAIRIVTHCALVQNIFLHITSYLTPQSCAEFFQCGSLSSLRKPFHFHDTLRIGNHMVRGIKAEVSAMREIEGLCEERGVSGRALFWRPAVSLETR